MKIKNRSQKYGINRSRHECKYSKYKTCLEYGDADFD